MAAAGDLAFNLVDFLLLPEVALCVPGVLLAVRARVARMPAELAAQLGDVAVAAELVTVSSGAPAPVTAVAGAAVPLVGVEVMRVVGVRTACGYSLSEIIIVMGGARNSFWILVTVSTGRAAAARRGVHLLAVDLGAHRGDQVTAVLRRALAERGRNAEPVDRVGGNREVDRRQLLELALDGEDEGSVGAVGRELVAGGRRVQHHGKTGPAP